jgi:hypothetical protein
MIGRHACFIGSIGMLAGVFVPLLGAQTAARHVGGDVRTLDLLSHPDANVLANARRAFRQGDIVRMAGGKPEDLQRLLGIGGALLTRNNALRTSSRNAGLLQNAAPLIYQVVAARATRTGALHEFLQLGKPAIDASSATTLAAYEIWAENERSFSQQQESGSLPTDPQPPAQAWTELQQTTLNDSDDSGNIFQNTVSVFRLNDISPQFDWYMVLTDPQSQPNYKGCIVFGFGACGWWTHQRVFTMSTTPQSVLFDHGPLNTITSTTASFSIGGLINSTGPGVNAGYSVSWQQQSVTTTDQSELANGVGKWNEAFEDEGVFTKPPETSIGLFLSHQGSIFQVPEGTSSFQFTLDEPVTYAFQPHFGNLETDVFDDGVQINIFPPVFVTSLNNLSIPPGGSGSFEITAVNPSTSNAGLGLAWDVSNLPSWLTVSQTSGSSSARLVLNVAPGTALGTVASINVNTNPEFAAPSVEQSPLLVRVTVGQPNDTGVLLSGGNDAQGRVQNLADLYSPQLGQFDFEAAMQSPRTSHTATLLLSGELLLAGGNTGPDQATATAELFNPDAAQFSSTAGMMTDSRAYHTATLLQNGKVLLAGGIDNAGSGGAVATAELYDPNTGIFTATGSMTTMRAQHSSTALLDGTVLLAGGLLNISLSGSLINTAEIYDPNTGRFTATAGNLVSAVASQTATRLKDGHVLIAGGFNENGESNAAELYNPATRTFSAVGSLNVARAAHSATLLSDGTVLIAGGQGNGGNALASAELYNPEMQSFTLLSAGACPGSAGCMTTARSSHTATPLLNGTVLLACGSGNQSVLGSTEIYNPQTKTFSVGPSTTPKTGHTATLLQRAPTTVTLTSSSNPSTAGQKITLTARVKTGDAVAPTGSVTFLDGTNVLQTTGLQTFNKGVATFSSESLSVGPHSLTAQYSGDGTYGRSTSSVVVQKVNTQATTTTLRSSPNPSNEGQLVTFSATVAPASSGTPTGSVIFRNNGAELSTVGLTGNTAAYSTSSLGPGGNPITATYTGDASFTSSGSPVLIQNVAKLSTTISLGSNPNPSTLGQIVVITATVSSTGNPQPSGTVLFHDGKKILQTVPVVSGAASFKLSSLSVGSHSITGTYSGDLTHAGATSAPILQQVTVDTATVSVSSSLNPSSYGQIVTFTATVNSTSGTPTGTVTFSDASKLLGTKPLNAGVAPLSIGTLTAGTHQIRATYSGDANHAKATSSLLRQVVNEPATTTALNSAPNPSKVGQAVILTATVFNDSGGSPSGIVTFLDGAKVLGKSSVNGGVAALTVSSFASGSHDLTASYSGDANFTGSTSNVLVQTVAGLVTPTVVLAVQPSTANAGDTVTFTATVSYPGGPIPTGSITISDVTNGAKIYGVASLKKGVGIATNSTIPPGSYNLVATYGGDGGIHYSGAHSDSAPLRIVGE